MRVLAALFGVLFLICSQALSAPIQWSSSQGGNDHYYDWVPGYLTWTQARDTAAASTYLGLPGTLATVTTASENTFFASNFSQSAGPTLIGWLGGYQDTTANDYAEPASGWRWVTGETWSYTSWWVAQSLPDNANGGQNHLRTQPVGASVYWDDLENNPGAFFIAGYFVEFAAVPEPGALGALALASFALLARRRSC